jgi:hypothetical protein
VCALTFLPAHFHCPFSFLMKVRAADTTQVLNEAKVRPSKYTARLHAIQEAIVPVQILWTDDWPRPSRGLPENGLAVNRHWRSSRGTVGFRLSAAFVSVPFFVHLLSTLFVST